MLEFRVSHSVQKYFWVFLPPQAIDMNLPPLLQYHLTRWEATCAGQGGSHLLLLGCSCSLNGERMTCVYALCSSPALFPVCWSIKYMKCLATPNLIGRLIWVQTDAESRASKAIKYEAYIYDYEWNVGKCFSLLKRRGTATSCTFTVKLSNVMPQNPQLWESCDYVKDSFGFVFPVLIPVGQRLKRWSECTSKAQNTEVK